MIKFFGLVITTKKKLQDLRIAEDRIGYARGFRDGRITPSRLAEMLRRSGYSFDKANRISNFYRRVFDERYKNY